MTEIIVENYFDAIIWSENCVKTHFQRKKKRETMWVATRSLQNSLN